MGQSGSGHIHVASRQRRSEECTVLQADVPLAVVEEILLNLPAHQVVRVCRLVCREWKELVDSASHWRERCRREGIQPCDASRTPEDWRLFYFLTKKQHNLLKNPSAEDVLQGWEIVCNEGDGWAVEGNRKPFPDDTVTKCFVTSYGLCLKRQLIDLKKEGYNAAFTDQVQPHIKISDWYAPCPDCGSEYQICVELLDQRKNPIRTFQPEKVVFPSGNSEPWCQCTALHSDVPDVPLAVVEEILLNLPAHQVVRVCRLVCREWKELVDSASHWRERCRREGIQPCDASRTPEDWRLFYFLTKKQHNLLKNPRADDDLQGWEIVCNGGDHWAAEINRKPFPDDTVTKCFVTSYGYAPRFDCGCQYEICVELLDQKKNPIRTFQPEKVLFEQWNDEPWCQMTHVFKDYGRGVRFIRFTHGGVDTQYWAGHYGIRVTNSSVEICPSVQR
ncbi:F-box only protein 44 [Anabarilius grahami]|uniref:F-box only protein 44 n=1 Tax=Anabarilius grahami TaxID=495550 RepID=A0A3N0Z402_ANAGA|nr:F-box only protein 44 [Anabarilius grahami]